MITIDEAIYFQKKMAAETRQKLSKKSKQSFKNKNKILNDLIVKADSFEQSALLLERLKIIEILEKIK